MKSNKLLILAFAVSGALAVSACHRDEADEADHAAAVVAPAPAAPASIVAPAASTVIASTAALVDSGLSFAAMDLNHDGFITADELHDNEMLKQHFKEADTNGDGKLSEDEVAKHRAAMAAKPGG